MLRRAADYLRKRAQYNEAERLYQRAWHIQEQTLGGEHLDVVASLRGLAMLYEEQGMYEQAESLYRQALSVRERVLGPLHLEVASATMDLGILYAQWGKYYGQAEVLFERALHIREQALGPLHLEVAKTLYNLAELSREQGKYQLFTDVVPEVDPLRDFLATQCELHPRAWCRSSDPWQAYICWVEKSQERYPLSRGAFIAQLKARGCRADRTNAARIWRGIALVKDRS